VYDEWLIEQAAMLSVRLERCRIHDWALRMLAIERAEGCWDDDRRLAAEEQGARITRQPGLITRRLRRTRQGCEWLLERWKGLATTMRDGRDWTEAQRALALNLLGTADELRDVTTRLDPPGADDAAIRAARLEVAEAEIAALGVLRGKSLAGLDESERLAAMMGFAPEPDRAIQQMMNYESASSKRMSWVLNQLIRRRPPGAAAEPTPACPAHAPTAKRRPEIIDQPIDTPIFAPDAPSEVAAPVAPAEPPDAAIAPEPSASAPAFVIGDLVADEASPTPTLRFDAAPEPTAIPAPSVPQRKGMAGLFASPTGSEGNRRSRRAQLSRDRRG
jgi:hypothetical protein